MVRVWHTDARYKGRPSFGESTCCAGDGSVRWTAASFFFSFRSTLFSNQPTTVEEYTKHIFFTRYRCSKTVYHLFKIFCIGPKIVPTPEKWAGWKESKHSQNILTTFCQKINTPSHSSMKQVYQCGSQPPSPRTFVVPCPFVHLILEPTIPNPFYVQDPCCFVMIVR